MLMGFSLAELMMLGQEIFRRDSSTRAIFVARGVLVVGIIFVVGLLSLGLLRQGPAPFDRDGLLSLSFASSFWFLLAVLPTWAADITAYLVGSKFGRRKLAPKISPGKTWEGTLAGLVAAALAVVAMGAAADLPRNIVGVVAVTIGPLGLAGDLIESALKRVAGVKDSGTLLPGHGGILDRLDSLTLASLPVLWAATTSAWRMG